MKKLFLIFLLLSHLQSFADTDTVLVKDFEKEWLFYDGAESFPLVRKSDFKGNTIHFEIDIRDFEGSLLKITYPKQFSLFVNEVLIASARRVLVVPIAGLGTNGTPLTISIYAPSLNPFVLTSGGYKVIAADVNALKSDVVLVNPKRSRIFHNFYVASITFLLFVFSVVYSIYPRPLGEYFKLRHAISAREIDENLLKSRPFTGVNMSVCLFISLLISQLIISISHLAGIFPERGIFYPDTFFQSINNWLLFTLVIFISIYFKYFLLVFFTYLFDLKNFLNNHFFNFLRLTLMSSCIFCLVCIVTYLGVYHYGHSIFVTYYYILLAAILPVMFIIFLKLRVASVFKNLHLFSYFCSTELIPFIVILSLGLN